MVNLLMLVSWLLGQLVVGFVSSLRLDCWLFGQLLALACVVAEFLACQRPGWNKPHCHLVSLLEVQPNKKRIMLNQ